MIPRANLLAGWSLVFLASLGGCISASHADIDPRVAAAVQVSKLEPPPGCASLGPIEGGTVLGDVDDARQDLVAHAVLNGGNFVTTDIVERRVVAGVGGYTLRGRLFRCPTPGQPPPVAVVAPAPAQPVAPSPTVVATEACEPDCSPGYACVQGSCVPACNPACGAGQACGADRVCHAK